MPEFQSRLGRARCGICLGYHIQLLLGADRSLHKLAKKKIKNDNATPQLAGSLSSINNKFGQRVLHLHTYMAH